MEKLVGNLSQRRINGLSSASRHLVVVPSSPKSWMVDKIPYWPYRPATDLRYLTGHTEPNSALVIEVAPGCQDFRSVLFVGDPDPAQEKWEGPKTTPRQASFVTSVLPLKLPLINLETCCCRFLKSMDWTRDIR